MSRPNVDDIVKCWLFNDLFQLSYRNSWNSLNSFHNTAFHKKNNYDTATTATVSKFYVALY